MTIKGSYLFTVIVSVLLLFAGHKIAVDDAVKFQKYSQDIARAKITGIIERVEPTVDFLDDFDDIDESRTMLGEKIIFEARITSGIRKGETVKAEQTFSPFVMNRSKEVSKGDYVLLINNNIGWFFGGYMRINRLLGLGILFTLCVLFFGGKKGFNTIFSLGLTCAAIFAVFIPAILSGKNIYVMSILVCVYTIAMTLLIVIGLNRKSLASVAGCVSGVMVAGIIAVVMDKALFLTGIIDEHSRYLVNLPGEIQLDLKAIVFAGIIIGGMGAIMDVAISLASSLWELKEKAKAIKFRELFRSGLNIGRDIMGSMANTLILAYIGSSLTVVILLSVYSDSWLALFNSEMIAVEILQALAGSLGILFAMPLTAFFCSIIYLRKK